MRRKWKIALLVLMFVAVVAAAVFVTGAQKTSTSPVKVSTSKQTCSTGANGKVCSGNGTCSSGKCVCASGFGGTTCDQPKFTCPTDAQGSVCGGHGKCTQGACVCDAGWNPHTNCESKLDACPVVDGAVCNGHGTCDSASNTCTCDEGFFGVACQTVNQCSGTAEGGECDGHGTCDTTSGTCVCDEGFSGEACQLSGPSACDADTCNGHGTCDDSSGTPVCTCYGGYQGAQCEHMCPINKESGHICSTYTLNGSLANPSITRATCELDSSYKPKCVATSNVFDASVKWVGGCASGYTPSDANPTFTKEYYEGACELACPKGENGLECSGNGTCVKGTCICADAYTQGDDTPSNSTILTDGKGGNTHWTSHDVTFCPRVSCASNSSRPSCVKHPMCAWDDTTNTCGAKADSSYAKCDAACACPVYRGKAVGSAATVSQSVQDHLTLPSKTSSNDMYYGPVPFAGTFLTNATTSGGGDADEEFTATVGSSTQTITISKSKDVPADMQSARGIPCFANGVAHDCGVCECLEGYDEGTGCQLCAKGYDTDAPLATATFHANPMIYKQNSKTGEASFVSSLTPLHVVSTIKGGCNACIFTPNDHTPGQECPSFCKVLQVYVPELTSSSSLSASDVLAALQQNATPHGSFSVSSSQLLTLIDQALEIQTTGAFCHGVHGASCRKTLSWPDSDAAISLCTCPFVYYGGGTAANPTCDPALGSCCVNKQGNFTVLPSSVTSYTDVTANTTDWSSRNASCGGVGLSGTTPKYLSTHCASLTSKEACAGLCVWSSSSSTCGPLPAVQSAGCQGYSTVDPKSTTVYTCDTSEYDLYRNSVKFSCGPNPRAGTSTSGSSGGTDSSSTGASFSCPYSGTWMMSSNGAGTCNTCMSYKELMDIGSANLDTMLTANEQEDLEHNTSSYTLPNTRIGGGATTYGPLMQPTAFLDPKHGTVDVAAAIVPTSGGCCVRKCPNPLSSYNEGKQAPCGGDDGCGGTCPSMCDHLPDCQNANAVENILSCVTTLAISAALVPSTALAAITVAFLSTAEVVGALRTEDLTILGQGMAACVNNGSSHGCVFVQDCGSVALGTEYGYPSMCGNGYRDACPSDQELCNSFASSHAALGFLYPLCDALGLVNSITHTVEKAGGSAAHAIEHAASGAWHSITSWFCFVLRARVAVRVAGTDTVVSQPLDSVEPSSIVVERLHDKAHVDARQAIALDAAPQVLCVTTQELVRPFRASLDGTCTPSHPVLFGGRVMKASEVEALEAKAVVEGSSMPEEEKASESVTPFRPDARSGVNGEGAFVDIVTDVPAVVTVNGYHCVTKTFAWQTHSSRWVQSVCADAMEYVCRAAPYMQRELFGSHPHREKVEMVYAAAQSVALRMKWALCDVSALYTGCAPSIVRQTGGYLQHPRCGVTDEPKKNKKNSNNRNSNDMNNEPAETLFPVYVRSVPPRVGRLLNTNAFGYVSSLVVERVLREDVEMLWNVVRALQPASQDRLSSLLRDTFRDLATPTPKGQLPLWNSRGAWKELQNIAKSRMSMTVSSSP